VFLLDDRQEDLASVLENFHVREVFHVTFGLELKDALVKHEATDYDGLKADFAKPTSLFR
jgi:hypothetical protein